MNEALPVLHKEEPAWALHLHSNDFLLSQPALDRVGTVFSFPFLPDFVIAAFRLDDFARVRILVDLDGASLAGALSLSSSWSAAAIGLRFEDGDDVAQAVAILAQQIPELLLELDLTLQAVIVFKGFKLC